MRPRGVDWFMFLNVDRESVPRWLRNPEKRESVAVGRLVAARGYDTLTGANENLTQKPIAARTLTKARQFPFVY